MISKDCQYSSAVAVFFGREFRHNSGRIRGIMRIGPVTVDKGRLAEICRRYGVRELSIFWSTARGEARPDSDIDLLVDFLPDAEPGLLDHAGLMLDLSDLLQRKVDLVSKKALKPLLRDSVTHDARRFYAA